MSNYELQQIIYLISTLNMAKHSNQSPSFYHKLIFGCIISFIILYILMFTSTIFCYIISDYNTCYNMSKYVRIFIKISKILKN